MKFSIDRDEFYNAIKLVAKIAPAKSTFVLLTYIKLEAVDNSLRISATDNSLQASVCVACEVSEPGEICISASFISELTNKLPSKSMMSFKTNDKSAIVLKCGKSTSTIPYLRSDDFPQFQEPKFDNIFELEADQFRNLFAKTLPCASDDAGRAFINCVMIHHSKNDTLRTYATDGHFVAKYEVDLPDGASGLGQIMVPRLTAAEMLRFNEHSDAKVKISASPMKFRFEKCDNSVQITSGTMDGSFPDCTKLTGWTNTKSAIFDRLAVLDMVDRVSIFCGENIRMANFKFADHQLEISAHNHEGGSSLEQIDGTYSDDEIKIGFQAKKFSTLLKLMDTDSFVISLSGPQGPGLFQEREGSAFQAILMPCRLL